jgi:putative FmdB family regulatory protein
MPTYDYLCAACGHRLELFQSMAEAPKKKCPDCGKKRLERQIGTGAGFIFRGAGFYLTDYRSESYKQRQSSAEQAAGGAGDAPRAESKTDSASAAPPAQASGASSAQTGSSPSAGAQSAPAPGPRSAPGQSRSASSGSHKPTSTGPKRTESKPKGRGPVKP